MAPFTCSHFIHCSININNIDQWSGPAGVLNTFLVYVTLHPTTWKGVAGVQKENTTPCIALAIIIRPTHTENKVYTFLHKVTTYLFTSAGFYEGDANEYECGVCALMWAFGRGGYAHIKDSL